MHVVIRPIPRMNKLEPVKVRVQIIVREGIKAAFPPLDSEKIWELDEDLRKFLLEKCINLERAAWHCPNKIRNQSRSLEDHHRLTREGQIQFLFDKFLSETKEY